MPPLIHTDERRGIYNRQISIVPSPVSVKDIHELSVAKQEQLCRRKSLNTELERRRKVKFTNVKTAFLEDVPPASNMLAEEKKVLWWNEEELKESLQSMGKLMRSLSMRPRNYNSTEPYHTLLYRIDECCRKSGTTHEASVNIEDIKLLANWHRASLSKRGLEKLVLDSKERNFKVRETIVYASTMARKNSNIDEAMKAECVRVCSERLTKPDRLFATALGEADASCLIVLQGYRRTKRGI